MSYWSLFRAALATAEISIPTVVESLVGAESGAVYDQRLRHWAQTLVEDAKVRISVRGEFPQGGSYLLLSNHESLYDIPVLFSASPLPLRMAAKSELFRIPVWGRAMRIAGFVEINRSKGRESRKRLKAAAAALAEHGRSLWLAPEGTRGDGITLGEFKTGAFEMALELQLPIIPISIAGTAKILGRGKNKVERGVHVDVTVHPVVSPRDYPVDHHILRDQVRDTIRAALSHAS